MSANISSSSSLSEKEKEIQTMAQTPAAGADAQSDHAHQTSNDNKNDDRDVEQAIPDKSQGPPPGAFDPRQNPDGGVKAWLCVLGGFCALFCSFGWINCVGVFQDYYQTHQLSAYSPSTISWISSLEIFSMFFFGPAIGKIFDNYGPRHLLVIGTFLEVFGLMMTSLATEYYQILLAQGLCSSIGASMVFYPAMSTITTWFFGKRAFAFGIIAAGSSLGGVILPIMVQRLIVDVGFPWAMRSVAFLILFMLAIANLAITSRMAPNPTPLNLMEFVVPFKELPFDLVCLGSFLFFMGMFLPINYIITSARHFGMSESLAQYLVPILNAASLFGRTIPGYVADKIGRFNMMVIMTVFTAIIILALWLPAAANAPIIVFAALFGFGSGAFVSLAPSLIAQISDVRKIGVRTGTLFAVISIAALISNPIGGQLITRDNGNYTQLQIYAGVMCLGGAFFIILARVRLVGAELKAKI